MFTVGLESSAVSKEFKAHALRGTGRYVGELLNYFQHTSDSSFAVEHFSQAELFKQSSLYQITENLPLGKQTVRQQLFYPFWLSGKNTKNMDILHFPTHIDAPSWTPKRYIVTVLDLIPVVLKELYAPKVSSVRFKLARSLELKAIKNAELILTISEHTALDVHRVLGVPYEKMRVTPLGVGEEFFQVQRGGFELEIEERFHIPQDQQVILYVGGIDQRKNMKGLIDIFSKALSAMREKGKKAPRLVFVGDIKKDREYLKLVSLIKENGLEECVTETGYLADADLYKFYSRASLFLFPSLYEGFGLPPLEAMAAGAPVVSSNTSAMPEVLGGAALLFSPSDVAQGVEHVLTFLESEENRNHYSELGRVQARKFTWEKTGETTLQAYQELRGS